jgi:hypothetical protein
MDEPTTIPAAHRRVLAVVLAASVAVHLWGLYRPSEPVVTELLPGLDKLFHALGFGIPAVLAVLLFRRSWPLGVLAAHALVSEVVQGLWIPNRTGDVTDLLADLAGLVPALVLLRRLPSQAPSRAVARNATASGSPTVSTSAAARRPNA